MDDGKYNEAISAFEENNEYKDSEIKIVDSITGETLETIICPDALFNN